MGHERREAAHSRPSGVRTILWLELQVGDRNPTSVGVGAFASPVKRSEQYGTGPPKKQSKFGSVTNREIAEFIGREGIEVDRHAIHLREPIKTVGDHRVEVRLLAGVEAQVTVTVVPAP